MNPDYLLIGHLTRDRLPDGSTTPGGTALYAAMTAQRLGRSAAIVSAAAPLPADWPASIAQAICPGDAPTFENRYTPAGRVQILHQAAAPIRLADVPLAWRQAPVIHFGPILGEVDHALIAALPASVSGITPQGFMRRWGMLPGEIVYEPWIPDAALLALPSAIILSVEDVRGDESLVQHYARHCRIVALTRGARGATLFVDGLPHAIPAATAIERDPTGAGDVFAAALLIRLHETGDPLAAAHFAAFVAARSVEGAGTTMIPSRAQIDAALPNPA
jgi:sugar/nucleoside kinase (ribokinase family)